MKTIDTSTYDFPTIIERGYVYVDKTAQLYELARPEASSIYYLPRPRRFGKSLMISTLKALFQGRRELFRGLAIEKADWGWSRSSIPCRSATRCRTASSATTGRRRRARR